MHQQQPTPRRGERGASATEYAFLIAGVAGLTVVLLTLFADSLAASWAGLSVLL